MPNEHVLHELERCQGCSVDPVMQHAIDEIMRALGSNLDEDALGELESAMPPPIGLPLRSGLGVTPLALDDLCTRVESRTGWRRDRATEFTQLLLRVVASQVRPPTVAKIEGALPKDWAVEWTPQPVNHLGPARQPPPPTPREREIAETSGTYPSVSASADDGSGRGSTLATGGGPAAPGEGHTLADGQPGSRRPLSGSR